MTDTNQTAHQLAALLAWYREMGVTAALDAEPVDWRARGNVAPGASYTMPVSARTQAAPPPKAPQPPRAAPARQSAQAFAPPLAAPATARPASAPSPVRTFAPPAAASPAKAGLPIAAATLAELGAALAAFEGCPLKATAKSICLYRGAEQARLMVIGEAPGRDEDLAGRPFVGPAGRLLDLMLAAIGLGEADVHITNTVYWRPPGNREPTAQEVLACAPFLARQIELVGPDVVLLLGGPAARHLLGTEQGIMKVRGKWHAIANAGREIAAMPTLHPAYVLRAPAAKRQVWRDLLAVSERLATGGG